MMQLKYGTCVSNALYIWCGFDRALSLICGNKMPTRCNIWFLLQILLLAQHVSGTIMPIIRSSRVLYKWLLPVVFGALVFKLSVWSGLRAAPNTTGSNHLYNTLELLLIGIMVPETCWASNKICNKNHMLHLVGILFPHINDTRLIFVTYIHCVIWGSRCGVSDESIMLELHVLWIGYHLPTFRKIVVPCILKMNRCDKSSTLLLQLNHESR